MPNLKQTERSIWPCLAVLLALTTSHLAASQSNVTTTQPASAQKRQQTAGNGGELIASEPPAIVNEDELAGERDEPAWPSLKKELPELPQMPQLAATKAALQPKQLEQLVSIAPIQQAIGKAQESVPQLMQQADLKPGAMPVSMSPGFNKSLGALVARLPNLLQTQMAKVASSSDKPEDTSIESLLATSSSLFNRGAVDASELAEMDCHLRNIDYCIAGILGASQKLMPETNEELEVRCDEMKATTSCLDVYNKRCGTARVYSMLVPFAQSFDEQRELIGQLASEAKLSPEAEAQLLSKNVSSLRGERVSMANLMDLCNPEARGTANNRQLRQGLFSLAKCINARVPKLNPCLSDLKSALQIFFEPGRVLPLQPTCCALGRFRACSSEALDRVCGLSSFEQLIESLGGPGSGQKSGAASGGPMSMIKTIDRVCRRASNYKSAYCSEVLPPSGIRVQSKRGNKASKLAKALDLVSFAPAIQEPGAL